MTEQKTQAQGPATDERRPGTRSPGPSAGGEQAAGLPEGDRWFADLVREQYRLVYGVAYQVLRSPPDAEDAAQEAFLKAFRNRHTVRDPAVVVGWLARIARNAALDLGRRRGRQRRLKDEVAEQARAEAAHPRTDEHPPVHEDERDRLRAAIAQLPKAEALVVTLRFLEGMAPKEMARRLGEKPTTVRVRLHRALKRLKTVLGADERA